ncbi:HTTM domain-containing protein [Adhaeribacter sp. BT258]|uniref:HTTM domain-containing protein n=1 Tax=Adhaeribacter terrigena TaxID=2793070 RepID=A0ABS1C5Z2_9BACT|nr:HTTM domain-containing protein [Adhaeribacter terrigena]MBK0404790.1 HTTM domain-containing protein [Adhaeribacter terrigena]
MHYLRLYLRQTFTLDLRALALFRIGLGALLLIDLYTRATDLEAHYANSGVLPLPALFQFHWNPYFFSFHTGSGLWQVQALFFVLAAAFAFCLLLGFKTRLATVLSWALLVSLHNRNPLILQGGDDLVRMLLFWSIFLPLGRFYSLDALKTCIPEIKTYFSAATVAIILQIFLLYFCTALLKSAPEWHREGTAIYYALSLDQILLPGGRLIYPYYDLLKAMTFGVYYTELLLPFLLLIPFYNSFFRMVVITALAMLHLGISLTLFVGLFYLINLVSLLALIPTRPMDWLENKLFPPVFNACHKAVHFCSNWPYPFSWQSEVRFYSPIWFQKTVRYGKELLVSFLLIYTICWNLANTPERFFSFPEDLRGLGFWLRVDQNWGMFSPAVFKDDGWYILEGVTNSDQKIDLNRNGKPVTYQKPAAVVSLFKNDRWRKYSENYLFVDNSWMRPFYCNYLMRIWNEQNGMENQVKSLDVIYMKEVSLDHYKTRPVQREVLCSCRELNE